METKPHKWLHWRYLVIVGRAKKKLEAPRRERVLVRQALSRIGVRYKETCPVITRYTGLHDNQDRAIQMLDFCCYKQGVFFVLLFDPKTGAHGLKEYERRSFQSKLDFLKEKHVPFIVIKRTETSQVYQLLVSLLINRHKRDKSNRMRSKTNEQATNRSTPERNDRAEPQGGTTSDS